MHTLLSIGEFSQLTYLSVKALRHYDDIGLLQPAEVDPQTGYRYYATAQVPAAHLINRFRDLDMPLDQVRAVLEAPDRAARDQALSAHLRTMEDKLEQTRATVASLRELLEGGASSLAVDYRSVGPTPAVTVRDVVEWDAIEGWLPSALESVTARLAEVGEEPVGPAGALYSTAFFERHEGEVVAFVPVRTAGFELPAARYAVTVHDGPFADLDRTYGALGTFVAERKLAVPGPIREVYVTDTRTEVCWPVTADA